MTKCEDHRCHIIHHENDKKKKTIFVDIELNCTEQETIFITHQISQITGGFAVLDSHALITFSKWNWTTYESELYREFQINAFLIKSKEKIFLFFENFLLENQFKMFSLIFPSNIFVTIGAKKRLIAGMIVYFLSKYLIGKGDMYNSVLFIWLNVLFLNEVFEIPIWHKFSLSKLTDQYKRRQVQFVLGVFEKRIFDGKNDNK